MTTPTSTGPAQEPGRYRLLTISERDTIARIMRELYVALERIKAPMELLAAVGSFNDTMGDDEILEMLEAINAKYQCPLCNGQGFRAVMLPPYTDPSKVEQVQCCDCLGTGERPPATKE